MYRIGTHFKYRHLLTVVLLLLLGSYFFTMKGRDSHTVAQPQPAQATAGPAGNLGSIAKWSTIEITLTGPDSEGMSNTNNPFLIEVDVTFTGPGGGSVVVPAFYDGDGSGGLDGNIWRVRFTPDTTGSWSYLSASASPLLNGHSGSFEVTEPSGCTGYEPGGLPNFNCVGRLTYTGDRYLKFVDGPYWLKGGADDPEDFLADGVTVGFDSKTAAIDYLAEQGANSLYILLSNVGGDANNVWPWVGDTVAEAQQNHEHFDVARLAEWEAIFSYLQAQGIVLHLVLEDDAAWTGFNRTLYYREMIARFGHHNGLYWNISEEYNENYSALQVQSFAQLIDDLDPYDHPVTVHNEGSINNWQPFLGRPEFDLTSFQTSPTPQNNTAVTWYDLVAASGRIIPLSFDETGQIGPGDRDLARHIIWSVYLGGASFELHTSPLSSYTQFAAHFADMHRARAFLEARPFWEMQPANALISGTEAYLFAQSGQYYLAYLPAGGTIQLDLSATPNNFTASWFNPRTGAIQPAGSTAGGGIRNFTAPDTNDWVLYLAQGGAVDNHHYLPVIRTTGRSAQISRTCVHYPQRSTEPGTG